MKVLVTGSNGQLGYDLMKELKKRNHEAIGVDINDMDITDYASVEKVLKSTMPECVIHCAAWTDVDAAQENYDECRMVNASGTENVAKVCKIIDAKLIYISTDYVFNGDGSEPWEPDDQRNPINIYGKTKFEGELAVEKNLKKYYIVRIAWLFGTNGKNFVKTMLTLAKTNNKLSVVNDQIGTPTFTIDLSRLLVDMAETNKYGCYHATNEGGFISWYDFSCEIFKQAGKDVNVLPVESSAYATAAKRPSNSRLSKRKLSENGFKRLPTWKNALNRFLNLEETDGTDKNYTL